MRCENTNNFSQSYTKNHEETQRFSVDLCVSSVHLCEYYSFLAIIYQEN
jgi:hypothetical protein